MKTLRFEKVGDIRFKYSYMEVFFENGKEPFMEIGVTDNRELCFRTYANTNPVELTVKHWEDILKKAKEFLSEALKDEENFESFMK